MNRCTQVALALVMAVTVGACQTDNVQHESVALKYKGTPAPAKANIPPPVYRVGDQWEYSDGYAFKVSEVGKDGRARFERLDAPEQWFVRRAFFKEESQSRTAHRLVVFRTGDPMALFKQPLKKPLSYIREYTRNGDLVRHRTSWEIEGKEKITVPAGTFDTWVLVMRTNSVDTNWQGYERWYYSPKVNGYVRMEFKYGESPDGARVLMGYKRAEK